MKKFMLASGAAILMAGVYVWGSNPTEHFPVKTYQNVSGKFVSDTLPKKKDTLPHKDTMRKKDSLQ